MSNSQSRPAREELPCDFLAFLEQRWKVSPPAALATLGKALDRYQPGSVAKARGAALRSLPDRTATPPAGTRYRDAAA